MCTARGEEGIRAHTRVQGRGLGQGSHLCARLEAESGLTHMCTARGVRAHTRVHSQGGQGSHTCTQLSVYVYSWGSLCKEGPGISGCGGHMGAQCCRALYVPVCGDGTRVCP